MSGGLDGIVLNYGLFCATDISDIYSFSLFRVMLESAYNVATRNAQIANFDRCEKHCIHCEIYIYVYVIYK